MMTTPYMPDSARAAMPQSPLQPLPAYLRPDFAQSVDRSRPRELVPVLHKGKPVDPLRLHCLQYRYLDDEQTVTVPNVWYNQTVEMRLSYWQFEAERTARAVEQTKKELKTALAWTGSHYMGEPIEKAVRHLKWTLEDRERNAQACAQTLADVQSGKTFA